MREYVKDPNAVLDWLFDWSDWLAVAETITAATITVDAGLTKDSSTNTTTCVTVWLSGGTVGVEYAVVCHITTNQGRQDDRSLRIRVTER